MNMRPILSRALALAALLLHCLHSSAQEADHATNQPSNAALAPLQGTWKGSMLGDQSTENITITVSSNSFKFHRDSDFWFETMISLPPATNPKQLHATIKGSAPSQSDAIGKVVVAIFKIEDGILTLASGGEIPKSFDDENASRYELRKIQPSKEASEQGRPASKEHDKGLSK
jgi:hypothetical protein